MARDNGVSSNPLSALTAVDGAGSLLDADFLDSLSSASFARSGANTDITSLAGTATNDSAAAGKIGEVISSTVAIGSAVSLTDNTAANLTSISLTAGDWDVELVAHMVCAATTSITRMLASISSTSATLDFTAGKFNDQAVPATVPTAASNPTVIVPPYRLSLASTTTVYGVVFARFTVDTLAVCGLLRARRMR